MIRRAIEYCIAAIGLTFAIICSFPILVVLLIVIYQLLPASAENRAQWAKDRREAPFHIVRLGPGKWPTSGTWGWKDNVSWFPDTIDNFAQAVDADADAYLRRRLSTNRLTAWSFTFELPSRGTAAIAVDPSTLKLGEETAFARDIFVRRVVDRTPYRGYAGPEMLKGTMNDTEIFYDPVVDAHYSCSQYSCDAAFIAGRYYVHFGFHDEGGHSDRRIVRQVIVDIRRALPRWENAQKSAGCGKDEGCG
jgi:hypothetical protein